LIQDYEINKNVADNVVKNFIESLEYAGLLKNGIILDGNDTQSQPINGSIEYGISHTNNSLEKEYYKQTITQQKTLQTTDTFYETPILPSGIQIKFPNSLTTHFVLGDFSSEIKSLEEKARSFLDAQKKGQEK